MPLDPKAKRKAQPLATMPEGRALRFTDVTPAGQRDLNRQMLPMGRAKSRRTQAVARMNRVIANPESSQKAKDKAAQRKETSRAMSEAGAFTDVDTTHETAAARRVGLSQASAERAARPAETGAGVTAGEDWYFQHHGKLAAVAAETGHDKHRVIAASAVMSPQNNPDQELEAVGALARAHADKKATIRISPEAASVRDDKGNLVLPNAADYVGRDVHPSRFAPADLAAVSNPKMRQHVQTTGDVDLEGMAKGGVKGNVTKAINVLRGNTPHTAAIDPHSSPKVWSYHESIKNSVPGTPEHEEFMTRMDVGLRRPDQERFDLYGLKESREGILSSSHPTAEDTWMQAISTGQQLRTVEIPGRTGRANQQSPAKFTVGEGGTALDKQLQAGRVVRGGSPSSVMHAWQSHATETAAGILSARSGEHIPSVGVQASGWTEARREAGGGKDAPYESRMETFHESHAPREYATPPPMFRQNKMGQEVPTAAAMPHAQGTLQLGGVIRLAPEAPKQPKSRRQHFEGGRNAETLF